MPWNVVVAIPPGVATTSVLVPTWMLAGETETDRVVEVIVVVDIEGFYW